MEVRPKIGGDGKSWNLLTLHRLTLLIVPVEIAAQPDAITLTEGKVYINDRAVSASASSSPFGIDSSSLIRTEIGRARVELHDGRSIFLNTNSTVRIVGDHLEILAGSVVISLARCSRRSHLPKLHPPLRPRPLSLYG